MSNPIYKAPNYTTQTASAYKANLDAAIAAASPVTNLGFSTSGGTFTVHGMQGTALASTNPAFVRFQDPDNFGYNKFISVEANQDFIDDAGASEIIGNLFGFTTGVAVDTDVTFYLYAVSNDAMDTVAFMISRDAHATLSPATGNIGAPDDAVANAAADFWSLESLDETLYDTNPCARVGSFRMQMSASDDWTVQALGAQDGIRFDRVIESEEWELISASTAATSASLDFTLSDEYEMFKMVMVNLRPDTDNSGLIMRVSTDGGSTFKSGASDYRWIGQGQNGTAVSGIGSTADTEIEFGQSNQGNAAGEGLFGEILIHAAFDSAARTIVTCDNTYQDNSGTAGLNKNSIAGDYRTIAITDAVQLLMDSGNLADGTVYLYGKKGLRS